MRIGGIIDISTKDIPNKSVMVMFTVGCNLNCGFCHNKFLLNRDIGKEMFVAEIIEKIRDNRLISGVSISGGEPTLQPDIFDLCELIKSMDKYVSLDTNNQKDKDFEIRTTYVENLLTPEDIHQIILWLQNNNFRGTFVLQQYQYSDGVTENYKDKFQKPDHISLINILKPYSKLELPFRIFIRDDIVGYTSLNNAIKKLEEK
jgi:pyruvate-formate lyase-activating enzyme